MVKYDVSNASALQPCSRSQTIGMRPVLDAPYIPVAKNENIQVLNAH